MKASGKYLKAKIFFWLTGWKTYLEKKKKKIKRKKTLLFFQLCFCTVLQDQKGPGEAGGASVCGKLAVTLLDVLAAISS